MNDFEYRSAWAQRVSISRGLCEANGMHHPDCPRDAVNADPAKHAFVLHHVIRRSDWHHPDYANRDDVQHLRLVFNGSTALGAGGCHGRIHSHQQRARAKGLLAEQPKDLWDVVD